MIIKVRLRVLRADGCLLGQRPQPLPDGAARQRRQAGSGELRADVAASRLPSLPDGRHRASPDAADAHRGEARRGPPRHHEEDLQHVRQEVGASVVAFAVESVCLKKGRNN